jgi:hypothetical protein
MKLHDLIRDTLGVAGCGMVAGGAGLIYLPAGLIVGGILLLGGAWLSARRG